MRHAPILALCSLVVLNATSAFGQAGLPGPAFEIGVDGTATLSSEVGGVALTPRITYRLAPQLDLTARGDATAMRRRRSSPYVSTSRLFDLELHQQMAHRGPVGVQGIVGVGLRTQRDYRLAYGSPSDRPNPTSGKAGDHVDQMRVVALMGVGAVQRAGRAIELRQDFRLSVDASGLDIGVSAGLTVPMGRYTTRPPGQSAVVGTRLVRTGQRVWATRADGTIVEGAIGNLTSSSIEILRDNGRISLDVDELRTVEIPDGIRDGIVRGAVIGGVGFGIYGALIAPALCECDDAVTAIGLTAIFAGMGAGGGALAGALSDSLHVGRRVILDRPTGAAFSMTPLVGRHRAGAIAAIRW